MCVCVSVCLWKEEVVWGREKELSYMLSWTASLVAKIESLSWTSPPSLWSQGIIWRGPEYWQITKKEVNYDSTINTQQCPSLPSRQLSSKKWVSLCQEAAASTGQLNGYISFKPVGMLKEDSTSSSTSGITHRYPAFRILWQSCHSLKDVGLLTPLPTSLLTQYYWPFLQLLPCNRVWCV